ncbi:molecular chaperone HscC [Massilia sp. METH4]|uniref:molecular chaperone HscC n=1 Tax=Massilia sp. METH4 TaxID=3123041 RepID=UPI0030D1B261
MIVGIDLGTTNSLVAVWENGGAHLLRNALGEVLTPSCVSIDDDGTVLVGRAARERLQTHPDRTAAMFKRHMGSNREFRLGKRVFRAEELSALVLRALKEDAEAALGQPVTEAVITVPAYFSDAQRKATRAAGQLAGLTVARLLNEPTAAALAYGIHNRDSESKFLVFDLGGGTFDVSVLDLFENVMEVRASTGDNFLGGEDFTDAIVQRFFAEAKLHPLWKDDARFMERARAQAEAAKRELKEGRRGRMALHVGDDECVMELDEADFDQLAAPLLARLRDPVERALRDARMSSADLDSIVLAGGATRMPAVRRLAARMFGRFPECDLNPDEVVALGAAVQAGLKMRDAALDEVVMTDVAPYSLGLETVRQFGGGPLTGGHFDPVIERNTIVPVSRVKTYHPVQEGQVAIVLQIYQGEARLVGDNIKLGELSVPLPPLSRERQGVDVRFTYDANGLLQVEATPQATGERFAVVIEGNPGMLSEAEIERRFAALSELKIHPRDRLENRTLKARGERLFQQLLGAEREILGQQIGLFELALESQDERRIRPAAAHFAALLGRWEHQSLLPAGD